MTNICPKCGFENNAESFVSCPKCGVVVSKFKQVNTRKETDNKTFGDIDNLISNNQDWKCACGISNDKSKNVCGGCGWTRKQTIDYILETASKDSQNIPMGGNYVSEKDSMLTDKIISKDDSKRFDWKTHIVLVVGTLIYLGGFGMRTTAPDSNTLNIGLLQDQMIRIHTGIALCLVWVYLYFGVKKK